MAVSDVAARPQLCLVCLRVLWACCMKKVQHVSADRVEKTVHTLWQFGNLNRPRSNCSRVNSITGRIKRAFILLQNKIFDMQTFAYVFYVGCHVFRTTKSHLQGHYRVWRSALQFKLQIAIFIKSQLATLCLLHCGSISRWNDNFSEYESRIIIQRWNWAFNIAWAWCGTLLRNVGSIVRYGLTSQSVWMSFNNATITRVSPCQRWQILVFCDGWHCVIRWKPDDVSEKPTVFTVSLYPDIESICHWNTGTLLPLCTASCLMGHKSSSSSSSSSSGPWEPQLSHS